MKKGLLTAILSAVITLITIAQTPKIIPQPVSLKTYAGYFSLNGTTQINIPPGNAECKKLGDLLAAMLGTPTGYHLAVSTIGRPANVISLKLNNIANTVIGTEGYTLKTTTTSAIITANTTKGLFYGIQTLLQLLPPEVETKNKVTAVSWAMPVVDITDYPRFGWRGLMLDVSRHFFPKKVVENYIDEMAKYKFNTFHWHLADDEGWRLEIKSLPQLTRIGAWRVMRTGPDHFSKFQDPQPGEKATYGGFYTQDDVREIIKYARDRYITILPEIDVPGHSLALIAAFPNLSCTQKQYAVDPGNIFYGKTDNVLCVANDSTYVILNKIFTEVAQLFPCQYIHIGGDEAYKGFWEKDPRDQALMKREGLKNAEELQSYFIKRIEKMITLNGKKLIGWDEILEGGLAPTATVMSWRGIDGGIAAAKQGHQVVMTPAANCYLDLYQGSPLAEPNTYSKAWLRDCFTYDPVPANVNPKLILGGEGALWTEAISDERQAQYMTWPRAMALAEVFWSPKTRRSFDEFTPVVEAHFKRLDAAKIKYARSIYDPVITIVKVPGDTVLKVKLDSQIGKLDIYYSFDTSIPDEFSLKYAGKPVVIPNGAVQIKAVTYRNGKPIGKQIDVMVKSLVNQDDTAFTGSWLNRSFIYHCLLLIAGIRAWQLLLLGIIYLWQRKRQ